MAHKKPIYYGQVGNFILSDFITNLILQFSNSKATYLVVKSMILFYWLMKWLVVCLLLVLSLQQLRQIGSPVENIVLSSSANTEIVFEGSVQGIIYCIYQMPWTEAMQKWIQAACRIQPKRQIIQIKPHPPTGLLGLIQC